VQEVLQFTAKAEVLGGDAKKDLKNASEGSVPKLAMGSAGRRLEHDIAAAGSGDDPKESYKPEFGRGDMMSWGGRSAFSSPL
jgi:hypothetical protein